MREIKIVFVLPLVMASLIVMLLSGGFAAGEDSVPEGTCSGIRGHDAGSYQVDTSEWICNELGGSWMPEGSFGSTYCCVPDEECCPCYCVETSEWICDALGGMEVNWCNWETNEGCEDFQTDGGKCVPEASTIALLATGLIGMVGYFKLRRKED